MDLNEQTAHFCKEVQTIMVELENANVQADWRLKLPIWDKMFTRFFYKDGQMVLYLYANFRGTTKKKIEEALHDGIGINHPIHTSAKTLSRIIDRIESGQFNPTKVEDAFQL